MSHHESTGSESLGSYSLDDEDQLPAEDTLDDRGIDDLLDEGYSPPERPRGVDAFGTTAAEQRQGESIEQRLAHEVPDSATVWRGSQADADRVSGGDDPDSFAGENDFFGSEEVGDRRSGRLIAHEGGYEEPESDMVADDVGIDGGGASAEEAAVHIIDNEPF